MISPQELPPLNINAMASVSMQYILNYIKVVVHKIFGVDCPDSLNEWNCRDGHRETGVRILHTILLQSYTLGAAL